MAHAFTPIPAKPTFDALKEKLSQSDYLNRKKGKLSYCRAPSYCNKIKNPSSYEVINTYNLGRYSRNLETCNVIPVNKGNLIIGQYTKLNLNNVCTVCYGPPSITPCSNVLPCNPCQNYPAAMPNTPVPIAPGTPTSPSTSLYTFYQNSTIDQLGQLFGNTQCGEFNYTQHMVFYPPTPTLTLGIS